MSSLTPILTTTPGEPPTHNLGIAETFSWIPVDGANRPLFAKATYLVNASDISLSAGDLTVDMSTLEGLTVDTNTLLDELTSIQSVKQDEIITLLHTITGSTIQVELNTDQLELHVDDVDTLLHDLSAKLNSQLGQSGFVFVQPSDGTVSGQFTTIQVVSACKLATIAATNSTTTGLTNYELPVNFTFNGPITSLSLTYGAAIVYKL
jgi:hypothetical protein